MRDAASLDGPVGAAKHAERHAELGAFAV